jgi:hypothetical protein
MLRQTDRPPPVRQSSAVCADSVWRGAAVFGCSGTVLSCEDAGLLGCGTASCSLAVLCAGAIELLLR